ncbi:endonuclease [Lactiplantibacillus pentosus]|uniref:Endonuclease n=1 Tax=Lactiplantibacillus pentosus TaxID=1589 RepID=A0ABX5CZX8_LACPE|nr:HNH endonuclease signature motif containing protein [Lactiplantibacillus pentosus]PRO94870.1 endonuclease [Lactiplantibacillus pentosus]
MRLKHCNWRGCTRLVKQGTDFCDEHKQADLERKQAYIKQRDKAKSTVKGKQLAASHMAHYNHTVRDEQANAFYHSTSWHRARELAFAKAMGVCECCGKPIGLDGKRGYIDHIVAYKVGTKEQSLSQANLWCLCAKCHQAKTQLEQSIKEQPNGDNKLAHISKAWWQKAILNDN